MGKKAVNGSTMAKTIVVNFFAFIESKKIQLGF